MFNWASSQFEKLSMAVAPPPTDPVSRFVFLMQKQSEEEALQCLMEMPDILHTVVQPTKGCYAIHLACQNSMMRLTQYILSQSNNIHITDGTGNTVLHYAALSQRMDQAVNVCRMLVTEFGASVLTKNAMGQTAYDVATLTSVRQYLLPIQLQLETQQALDNGGVGLPPGIDLGSLRIQQNMATAGPPPPTSFGPSSSSGPPFGTMSTATPSAVSGSGGPPHMFATPNPMSPPPVNQHQSYQNIAPAPATMPAPIIHQHYAAPTSQGSPAMTTPATSDNDSSLSTNPRQYARTGSSSAALDSITRRGKNFVRPDGFHSSSSDVNLQKKYGHVSVTKAVPPPPTSGNMGPLTSSGSGPAATVVAGGANPFSAGGAVLSGGVHRYAGGSALPHSSRRYPVYDTVSRSATSAVAPHSAPLASVAASSAPNFSVFTPGGAVSTSTTTSSWSQPQQQAQQQNYATTTQPYVAAPMSGSESASQWQQQQQQPSLQAGYYSQSNASTWQSHPNLYEEGTEAAPVVEQQQPQQTWQVGYDYGASQVVPQPTTMSSPNQNVPTTQAGTSQPEPQPVAAEAFFGPPPQATTTMTQPWAGVYNRAAEEPQRDQAATDVVTASQPEDYAGAVQQQPDSSIDVTPFVNPASHGTEPMTEMAVANSAASSIASTAEGPVETSSWSAATSYATSSQLPPRRPEPVSLIGTFDAEVKTVSGSSNVAEDFFSAPVPVSSAPAAVTVPVPVVETAQQPIAKAPASWGISPVAASSLNGANIAAGDFFSSPPVQQAEKAPVLLEPQAVDAVPSESAPAVENFPATSVATAQATSTTNQGEAAAALAISNCGPFSEPNTSAPINAAALFAQGLSKQLTHDSGTGTSNAAASLFDRQAEPTTIAARPVDAVALFAQGTGQDDASTTATSLFDRPQIISSPSETLSKLGEIELKDESAAFFSQGPIENPAFTSDAAESKATTSFVDQPPAQLNDTFGLSGLGGAESLEATTATKTKQANADDLFANGPAAPASVITGTTPDSKSSEAMHNSVLGDDELFDVALSPNSAKKAIALEAEATVAVAATTTTTPSINGAESLFAAIGLPPPPFSKR